MGKHCAGYPVRAFSDKVIAHLYNNHIADIELAHLQLSDEWLKNTQNTMTRLL